MGKRKTNPNRNPINGKRALKGDYSPNNTVRSDRLIPQKAYSCVGATRRTRAMAKGILIVMTVIVIFCIWVAFAASAEKQQVSLVEDGLYIRGDHVNLDGFLRSKKFFPCGLNGVDIWYRKNDGTEIQIVDYGESIVVRGTNIGTNTYDPRHGNLKECHVCWILSRDNPEDPGARNILLPVGAVATIFESEGEGVRVIR
ncbi:hypothetical protein IJV57_04720 [Candidatus Saccharibacteria bacterium]|nr:hypothetical protein [Candidatus Saccharibacteria bacterium]